MELGNTDNNVFQLHSTDETVASNVTPLRPVVELNIVELDNVVALHIVGEQRVEANESLCANGVCSLSWKPKRPSAA